MRSVVKMVEQEKLMSRTSVAAAADPRLGFWVVSILLIFSAVALLVTVHMEEGACTGLWNLLLFLELVLFGLSYDYIAHYKPVESAVVPPKGRPPLRRLLVLPPRVRAVLSHPLPVATEQRHAA